MKSSKALVALVVLGGAAWAFAARVPPGTEDQIRERLTPFGELCRSGDPCAGAAATASTGPMTGEQVYNQSCTVCHATGVAGAPAFGDAAAWAPRIDKGMDTLWEHTQQGFNAMPPKGTCIACSDEELRGAMEYMVSQVQ